IIDYVVHTVSPNSQPTKYAQPQPSYAAAPEAGAEADIERKVLCLVNKERRRVGLNSLTIHPAMTKAAREHSKYQASIKSMTHNDPSYGQLNARLKSAGFSFATAAENIAEAPAATAEDVFNMWMGDSGHYQNIVSPKSTYMGLACINGFWTQEFGSELGAGSPAPLYEAQDLC
ncbi:hypothetical protein IWW51_006054, partial [Coemansia sp. RSA 2702]